MFYVALLNNYKAFFIKYKFVEFDLLKSFLLYPYEVKGSTLTDGARALAKHVNRSSDKYWGNFIGSGENFGLLLMLYCCLIDFFHSSYNDIFLANSGF